MDAARAYQVVVKDRTYAEKFKATPGLAAEVEGIGRALLGELPIERGSREWNLLLNGLALATQLGMAVDAP